MATRALSDVDPVFVVVAKALYGDSVDPRELWDVVKGMPDGSASHVNGDGDNKSKNLARGLVLGTTAEGLATARTIKPAIRAIKGGGKLKAATAGGELALQAVNMGVGLAAAHQLTGGKKPKGKLTAMAKAAVPHAQPQSLIASRARLARARAGVLTPVAKAATSTVDVEFVGTISKIDDEKRQVFGWASLSVVDGEPVVDLQGDYVSIEEIEKSAYSYVLNSRKGGDMHRRISKLDAGPVHTADLVESVVITVEKLQAWGLEPDAMPLGWWVGYKVQDDQQWADVKAGKRLGFSIHGSGVRKDAHL